MEAGEASCAALTGGGDSESATSLLQEKKVRERQLSDMTRSEYVTVAILCFVNLINYMDRFTLAGNLGEVKDTFKVGDDWLGLLQTVFVLSYMVFAPTFGYLGDRYSRRYIMVGGVAMWSLTTFVGSYMEDFRWFMMFRGLVGVGEASYSTIAPTIISDLFVGNMRSKMLAMFYFAIPVGSGLGYIVGAETAAVAGDWRWGLRVTPFLGAVAVALLWGVMTEPQRGQAEESHIRATSYKSDINSLLRNPSFMLSTLAFTCVAFVTGALAWWGPEFIHLGLRLQPGMENVTKAKVSLTFGVITMASGIIGVPLGTWLGSSLVGRYPRAHPIICGAGLLISAPAMAATLYCAGGSVYAPFLLMFVAEIALNLNWAIVADMTLYVVIPPRRSTAEAFQILISHLFGDAGSPYLVGVLSESLKREFSPAGALASDLVTFKALQYSLFVTCFVEVIGGVCFLLTAVYIVRDKSAVDKAIAGGNSPEEMRLIANPGAELSCHEAETQAAEPTHRYAQEATVPAE